jgi:uncharacterized membrane protein YfcA
VSIQVVAGLILSGAIGLSLGLIGGGGSIITVPVLVYVMGVEAREAVAMSLGVVGATSLIGTVLHYRRGTVILKTGAVFGASGVIGAYFGSTLTYLVSPPVLLLTFAGLMLVIAALMLVKDPHGDTDITPLAVSPLKIFTAGLFVGFLTGFLGVGGGFLIVPALMMFGGLRMKEAVGTSLLAISINCAAGLAGHLFHGGFNFLTASMVTLSAMTGLLGGTVLNRKTSGATLQNGFAVFVIGVAVFLIAKNYALLLD